MFVKISCRLIVSSFKEDFFSLNPLFDPYLSNPMRILSYVCVDLRPFLFLIVNCKLGKMLISLQ